MTALAPPAPPVNTAPRKLRRRRINQSTWYGISSALSRQHTTLAQEVPDSPRIRPSLPRPRWMEREPGTAVNQMMEAA